MKGVQRAPPPSSLFGNLSGGRAAQLAPASLWVPCDTLGRSGNTTGVSWAKGNGNSRGLEFRNLMLGDRFLSILLFTLLAHHDCMHAGRLLPHCSDKGPGSQIPGVDL